MATAIQPLEQSSSQKPCTNLSVLQRLASLYALLENLSFGMPQWTSDVAMLGAHAAFVGSIPIEVKKYIYHGYTFVSTVFSIQLSLKT